MGRVRGAWMGLIWPCAAGSGCRTDVDGPLADPPDIMGAPGAGRRLEGGAAQVEAGAPRAAGCAVGQVHCSGRIPQSCGADGTWQSGPACAYACEPASGGCVNHFTAAAAGRGAPTDAEGVAEFTRNSEMLFSKGGGLFGARGFNVAVLDPRTGQPVEAVRNFDPWDSPLSDSALEDLADYLEALEPGRLVMVATCDDAGINRLNSCELQTDAPVRRLIATLTAMGSQQIGNLCFRGAWSFAAVTGQPVALAEKLSQGAKVTAEVVLRQCTGIEPSRRLRLRNRSPSRRRMRLRSSAELGADGGERLAHALQQSSAQGHQPARGRRPVHPVDPADGIDAEPVEEVQPQDGALPIVEGESANSSAASSCSR